MSGEAGGVIIGGLVVAALLPVVATGAAAVGLAYGAVRLGVYLAKNGAGYARQRRLEQQLVVTNCSAELDAAYAGMRAVLAETAARQSEQQEALGNRLQAMGEQMRRVQQSSPSTQALEARIAETGAALRREFGEKSRAMHRQILDEAIDRLNSCSHTLEQGALAREEAVDWIGQSEGALAAQKAAAEQALRDAEASVQMLRNAAKGSTDAGFRSEVRTMESALSKAKAFAENGACETAFGAARTVIRTSAMLASNHALRQMEADALATELCARLAGLEERMEQQRLITIQDPTRKDQKTEQMDLNRFSQGRYCELIDELRQLRERIEADGGSCEQLENLTEQLDNELEPRVDTVIDCAKERLLGFVERRHVLEVVSTYMQQQNYTMNWATTVGKDLTQKLVVSFTQQHTGNEVSVTLDADADAAQIQNMAMEILTFYSDGKPVSEQEKKTLRDGMSKALEQAGLGSVLGCKGQLNMPSERREYADRKAVQKMPTTPITG